MPRPPKFEITDSTNGPALIVRIGGELDMSTAQALSQHLDERLSSEVGDLTLDLRDVSFMDSSGLRFLIELCETSRDETWDVKLIAPEHEAAALVLRATGADTALPFDHTLKP